MTEGPKSSGDTASTPVLLGHPFNHRLPVPPVPTIPTDGCDTVIGSLVPTVSDIVARPKMG